MPDAVIPSRIIISKRLGDRISENQSPTQLWPTTCLPLSFLLGHFLHCLEHAIAEVRIGNRELDVEHKEARKHERGAPLVELIGVWSNVVVLQRPECDNGERRRRDMILTIWRCSFRTRYLRGCVNTSDKPSNRLMAAEAAVM